MPSITEERQQIRKQFEHLTGPEAETKITVSPSMLVYEAKFALQQLKDHIADVDVLVEIIEPLARAVGWAEASAYVFDRQMYGSVGAQVPTGNGRSQVRN